MSEHMFRDGDGPFCLIGHKQRDTMLGNPLSGQHRQRVHQNEGRLASFEPEWQRYSQRCYWDIGMLSEMPSETGRLLLRDVSDWSWPGSAESVEARHVATTLWGDAFRLGTMGNSWCSLFAIASTASPGEGPPLLFAHLADRHPALIGGDDQLVRNWSSLGIRR